MHNAGELAAGLAKLGFRVAGKPRIRAGTIDHEDAPDWLAPELLADPIGLIERVERLSDRPEVEWARLDR